MRILFLALDIDLNRQRGDSVHALSLAKALARVGNRVHLVVGAVGDQLTVPGLEFSVRPSGGDFSTVRYVWRLSRRFGPDVIYERRFSPKISAAVSVLSRRPYVVEVNGLADEEAAMQGRPLGNTPGRRFKANIRSLLLRHAAAVVAVAPGLSDAVVSEYGVSERRVFTIENGVDERLFQPMDCAQARAMLKQGAGTIICFVGNLVAWQGIPGLLYAMQRVPGSVRLLIVGDGPDRQRIVDLVGALKLSNRVEFVGNVPHSKVPQYIAASDVCVAPFTAQRNLNSGVSALKMFEYLACARPVVVSAIPGARELVETTGAGVVVPPDQPEALGQAIERVVKDPAYGVAANRASDMVRRVHSWDAVADSVIRVLATAATRPALPLDYLHREAHRDYYLGCSLSTRLTRLS